MAVVFARACSAVSPPLTASPARTKAHLEHERHRRSARPPPTHRRGLPVPEEPPGRAGQRRWAHLPLRAPGAGLPRRSPAGAERSGAGPAGPGTGSPSPPPAPPRGGWRGRGRAGAGRGSGDALPGGGGGVTNSDLSQGTANTTKHPRPQHSPGPLPSAGPTAPRRPRGGREGRRWAPACPGPLGSPPPHLWRPFLR